MFYTGLDPSTMKPVYIPREAEEKAMQRALLQYFKPENSMMVRRALIRAGRRDLIGSAQNCLVAPDKRMQAQPAAPEKKNTRQQRPTSERRQHGRKKKTI